MDEPNEPRPLKRRAFLTDLAASGAALVGAIAIGIMSETAQAGPPKKSASPSPSPRPSASPPREHDNVRPAGDVPAPTPSCSPENDHILSPGKMAIPRATPTPTPSPAKKKPSH